MPTIIHKMTIAKAEPNEARDLMDFFNMLDCVIKDRHITQDEITNEAWLPYFEPYFDEFGELDLEDFLSNLWGKLTAGWFRVCIGYDSLVNTFCDKNLDHLAPNPDLIKAIDFYNKHHNE